MYYSYALFQIKGSMKNAKHDSEYVTGSEYTKVLNEHVISTQSHTIPGPVFFYTCARTF